MAAFGTKSSARPVELLTHDIPSPGYGWGFFCQTVAVAVREPVLMLKLMLMLNQEWAIDGWRRVRRWSLGRFQLHHHQTNPVTLPSWLL